MSIGDRLREFRNAVGLTQREVAKLCGLGKRTIIYWEMGEREIRCSKLVPLVHEYDLDFNWLILGAGSMFNPALTDEQTSPGQTLYKLEVEEPAAPEPPRDLPQNDGFAIKRETAQPAAEDEDVLPLIQRLRRR